MTDTPHLDEMTREVRLAIDYALSKGNLVHMTGKQLDAAAAAVVAVLGLREDWTVRTGGGSHPATAMSKEKALDVAARWPDSFTAICRLVSPWVVVEEQKK